MGQSYTKNGFRYIGFVGTVSELMNFINEMVEDNEGKEKIRQCYE